MKISKSQIIKIIPISVHTVSRLHADPEFPALQKIGRANYYDQKSFYDWLNSRASQFGNVKTNDKLIDTPTISAMLDRSSTWVWQKIIRNDQFTKVDLSPNKNSKNPRRYFIEREIVEAFHELIEIQEKEAA